MVVMARNGATGTIMGLDVISNGAGGVFELCVHGLLVEVGWVRQRIHGDLVQGTALVKHGLKGETTVGRSQTSSIDRLVTQLILQARKTMITKKKGQWCIWRVVVGYIFGIMQMYLPTQLPQQSEELATFPACLLHGFPKTHCAGG